MVFQLLRSGTCQKKVITGTPWQIIVCTPPPTPLHDGGWGEGGGLSHFSERLYRRDLGQIGILGGNWHFRWGWFFSGGTWKLPLYKKIVNRNLKQKRGWAIFFHKAFNDQSCKLKNSWWQNYLLHVCMPTFHTSHGNFLLENFLSVQVSIATPKKVFITVW